jgi:hypothetical protein
MVNIFYILAYGIMVVWFPLFMNLIFTLFVKRTKNNKFKLRWGKVKGYKNLNPIKSGVWSLIVLIIFELASIALNLVFFNELVNLISTLRFHTIPLFLSAVSFFTFWISKKDIDLRWNNKLVWIPFTIFCSIILIWMIVLIIIYGGFA